MRIGKENTIALAIDFQNRLYPKMFESKNNVLLKNVTLLLKGLQALDVPIFFSQQYTSGLGHTESEIASAVHDFSYFEKMTFSCLDEIQFKEILKKEQPQTIIVCGIESHICVQQTVIDLLAAGYRVVVIEDCVSSRKKSDKKTAIRRMEQSGAQITSYESILFELCRYANIPVFKDISRLIK